MKLPASNIVSTEWLNAHLDDPNLIVLDATLKKLPNGTLVNQEPLYIKGAQEFNYDTKICDQNTDLPHMLPSVEQFETAVCELGITKDSIIVCYDAMGIFSSPRAWWMFKIMGHDKVAILDGGLPKWLKENRPTQSEFSASKPNGTFKANFRPEMVYSAEQVLAATTSPKIQILDARSRGRFNATEPEPRPGMAGGHIPGSACLPFTELLENGCLKPQDQLKPLFESMFTPSTTRTVFSCGSGVTASILSLAANECGYTNLSVYDGSWAEWGDREDLPIETT